MVSKGGAFMKVKFFEFERIKFGSFLRSFCNIYRKKEPGAANIPHAQAGFMSQYFSFYKL